jgi:hypothetical protein
MIRRFASALLAAGLLAASGAGAQDARKETLVVANEFGPNIAGHPHRGRQPALATA